MRILLIHSDYLRFKARKKAIKNAEEIRAREGYAENVLVVFIAAEKIDEENPDSVVDQLVDEIIDTYKRVNAESIALYPYAHLSSSLASPRVAMEILNETYDKLKYKFKTIKAPFGWYKSFEIKCKGHPLSELSRSIVPEGVEKEKESKALRAEKKLKSEWYILNTDGELIPVSEFEFNNFKNLKKFADYEISKVRAVDKEPAHVSLMRSHEIADYEPGSDQGNLRWYPKGSLIKRLLEEHVSNIVSDYGGMQVETPVMYDTSHPQLSKYLDRFPARQYILKSGNKEYFLRFAACFGQYLMKRDMVISYRNLPLRLYELSHYSFRYEQSGELVGLRRLRAFTMPDMHTLVRDMEQAKEEFLNQYKLAIKWMNDLELDYEIGIRFVRDFYEENKEFATKLVEIAGKPVLIEIWDERPFYFVMKFEFNFVDSLDKASALSTVQIDIENTERFGITYVDEDGREKFPLMLHASISGSIDRNVYALLEKAYLDKQKGKKPMLPLWLSPTQVRILPVSDEFMKFSEKILEVIESNRIRVDIDDRNESIGRKIRDAEREWIPYIVVIGEKELKSNKISVRRRSDGKHIEMTVDCLVDEIKNSIKEFPFKPLPLSRFVSKRPRFVG
ncbi:MAG: threonine--tRNA ligase [Candidatus Altiarchaeales archaeon]|nr:MAG: threonine--tRNA ligase [Candidatus Altiarchaeales archaeon]HDO82386.1 threonine--tRNA ligase [Candidatus Altiarchaeales archaeon]HEX55035.1 threonine--tRNA ligase [Candidatus Altiarchaeales archaeon]